MNWIYALSNRSKMIKTPSELNERLIINFEIPEETNWIYDIMENKKMAKFLFLWFYILASLSFWVRHTIDWLSI